jgi:hypothetical protein
MAEEGVRPGRRRRLLLGAFLGLLLAGLGTAAAYALSTHTTQAAQGSTTSGTTIQQSTSQTKPHRSTTGAHQATTAAQTTTAHHHRRKGKPKHHVVTSTVPTTPTAGGGQQKPPSKPVTISDAFTLGYPNPTTWRKVTDGLDVSLMEQGGQLELTVGAQAVPSGHQSQIDVHVATQCAFPGDFDARVEYKLLEWPVGENIYVGMNAANAADAVMRDNSSESGDGYIGWVGSQQRSVPFSSMGGSVRIARVNGIETTYFWHGGRWRTLASSREIGPAVIGLQTVSDGQNPFGGQELKVAFDNFKVTGMKPACP